MQRAGVALALSVCSIVRYIKSEPCLMLHAARYARIALYATPDPKSGVYTTGMLVD